MNDFRLQTEADVGKYLQYQSYRYARWLLIEHEVHNRGNRRHFFFFYTLDSVHVLKARQHYDQFVTTAPSSHGYIVVVFLTQRGIWRQNVCWRWREIRPCCIQPGATSEKGTAGKSVSSFITHSWLNVSFSFLSDSLGRRVYPERTKCTRAAVLSSPTWHVRDSALVLHALYYALNAAALFRSAFGDKNQ